LDLDVWKEKSKENNKFENKKFKRCELCSERGENTIVNFDKLNNALNDYYNENKDRFDKLLDVVFSSEN
jgi:hypothetical protein